MGCRIDAHRTGQLPAIAASQKKRMLMRGEKKPPDRECRRCFSRPADRQVAEANSRNADAPSRRLHTPRSDRAIDGAERTEQGAASWSPPKGWLTHPSRILKNPGAA
jgi:hypothetical protein